MTSLSFRARELWTDVEAVAAMEFAIVLPFMLLLFIGGVELSNGMAINVKVSDATHSVADMVSQNTQISAAQMQTILGASAAIMAPYPVNSSSNSLMTVTVSEISTRQQWQRRQFNGANRIMERPSDREGPVGQAITLPSRSPECNQATTMSRLSWVKSSYAYTPNLGYTITGTVTLRGQRITCSRAVRRTTPPIHSYTMTSNSRPQQRAPASNICS